MTEREREVLKYYYGQILTNAEIAQVLFLSEGTVRNYVSGLWKNYHAEDRTKAARTCLALWLGRTQDNYEDPDPKI